MKKILTFIICIMPFFISATTYLNTTSTTLTISKDNVCDDEVVENETLMEELYATLEPCMTTESQEILPNESIEFNNEQGQSVTVSSRALNEKREFYPTNNAFKYEISISKYPSRFSKITINSV